MKSTFLALTCTLMIASPGMLLAQGEAAVPFLLISSSPEANGWGNNATAFPSSNAINMIANPAQLGVFSLSGYFTGSSYAQKTQWLPAFQMNDLTYNVWAVGGGYDFAGLLDLPMSLALGVGYSRVDFNLGTFIRTGSGGPDPIETFTAYERSEALTVALGVDYFVRLGFGMSFGKVISSIGPIGPGLESAEARPSTTDFGLLLDIPIIEIIERANGEPVVSQSHLQPIFSISTGYSQKNIGDPVTYIEASQADPLPRNATIGLGMKLGVEKIVGDKRWEIFTFSLVREAEDLLVERKPNGTFSYQSGLLGDINFFKHVIAGNLSDDEKVNVHQGWQVNLGEILYVRGGSFAESPRYGNRNYTTSGYAIHTAGFFKLAEALAGDISPGSVVEFIGAHIDIAYDYAKYDAGTNHPLDDTIFQSLTLVIR